MTTRNSRVNPLNGQINWTAIIDETHTIELHSDKGLYGFYLTERPQSGSIVAYNTSTGIETGETMDIITFGTPQENQLYPDVRGGTCWVWANENDVGAVVCF